jgi:hypothetical protein
MRQPRASGANAAPGSQHPSYQEMLRAVGAILDEAGSNLALIHVSPARVRVLAVGPYGEHVLSIRYLAHCIDVQRQLRGQLPPRDPVDLTRLSPVLRAVGAELDRQQQPRYDLAVTQGAVIIEGSRGYRRTLAFDVLAELLEGAIRSRGPSSVD